LTTHRKQVKQQVQVVGVMFCHLVEVIYEPHNLGHLFS